MYIYTYIYIIYIYYIYIYTCVCVCVCVCVCDLRDQILMFLFTFTNIIKVSLMLVKGFFKECVFFNGNRMPAHRVIISSIAVENEEGLFVALAILRDASIIVKKTMLDGTLLVFPGIITT